MLYTPLAGFSRLSAAGSFAQSVTLKLSMSVDCIRERKGGLTYICYLIRGAVFKS